VLFNGTNGAIKSSGNVSSVTYNSTGNYTVNFTTAMPDANYSVSGTGSRDPGDTVGVSINPTDGTFTTTSVSFLIRANATVVDRGNVSVAIFR
jgi:hypothetical protein